MTWSSYDTWIVLVGIVSAMSCALPGCYLLLKRQSMMGDAISHAVLPGIAIAYLVFGTRQPLVMVLAALATGLLTAFLIQMLQRTGRLEEGAAMGVVFTTLFAAGLILIRQASSLDRLDLDPDCVLFGAIEYAPINLLWGVPRAIITSGFALLLAVVFVVLFYKELKLSAFDPALASTLGFRPGLMHYALMVLASISMVAAFESVGSILVIAMLIVPPAAAYLLTDRLGVMLVLSAILAAVGAALGHVAAITVPPLFGYPDTNTAGMMAVATGVVFLVVLAAAPRYGLISKAIHHARLKLRLLADDVLGLIFRIQEFEQQDCLAVQRGQLSSILGGGLLLTLALLRLRVKKLLKRTGDGWCLTPLGERHATRLVRSHRLWETFLVQEVGLRADHVHGTAKRLEQVTNDEIEVTLLEQAGPATHDPQGKKIPKDKQEP